MFFTSLFWDFLWWSWAHTRITFVVACMCIALQALLRHAIQYYSLWPSPALTAAIETSLLIQVRAGARWNQYTVTKIITEMHRINRKMICLKCFSFPFHLITLSEGGHLAPVACPSRSGMLESCWRGPSVDLRVVFDCCCGSSNSTCHHVVCVRRSQAPPEWRQPRRLGSAGVYTGAKEDVCQLKHRFCFFREILSWLCSTQSTLKGLAYSWWHLPCRLGTLNLGENPAPSLCFINAHRLPWEQCWIAHVVSGKK